MKRVLAFAIVLGLPLLLGGQESASHAYVPPNGFVPDSVTAVRVAVAIWTPIYGQAVVAAEAPFRAELRGDVWTVSGHLRAGNVGGVAVAEISKRDARVLQVSHGR